MSPKNASWSDPIWGTGESCARCGHRPAAHTTADGRCRILSHKGLDQKTCSCPAFVSAIEYREILEHERGRQGNQARA